MTLAHKESRLRLQLISNAYTQANLRLRPDFRYASIENLLVVEGGCFSTGKHSFVGTVGAVGQCFRSAGQAALRDPRLTYCEGVAIRGNSQPTSHAWCIDEQGVVIDNTWNTENPLHRGSGYFGVAFTAEYLQQTYLARKEFGLLDNPEMDWPLLRRDGPTHYRKYRALETSTAA